MIRIEDVGRTGTMDSRRAALAAALGIGVLVVGGLAGGRLVDEVAQDPSPTLRSAPSGVVSNATPEVGLSTDRARDDKVAFWEARLENGGGYASTMHLVDALIERSRATGDLADLARASSALDELEGSAPPNDPGLPERRGRIAFALHAFDEAVHEAKAALRIDPGSRSALALLGDASLELGDVAAADDAYAALAERGEGPAVLSRLARRAWLAGEVTEAEAMVREAIDGAVLVGSEDERAFYHYQLAEMLRWRNALPEAEDAYRTALVSQPDHAPSMGGLARVLEAQGQRDEAIEWLEAATARLPAPDLLASLGDLYALAGRDAEAADQWALVERIAEVAAAEGGLHDRQLVLFLADHGRESDRAVTLAEAELELRRDIYGWDAYAWALHAAGRFEEADAAINRALRLGTEDPRLNYHAGMIALALDRPDEARRHLRAAAAGSAALPPLQIMRLEASLDEVGS